MLGGRWGQDAFEVWLESTQHTHTHTHTHTHRRTHTSIPFTCSQHELSHISIQPPKDWQLFFFVMVLVAIDIIYLTVASILDNYTAKPFINLEKPKSRDVSPLPACHTHSILFLKPPLFPHKGKQCHNNILLCGDPRRR